MLRANMNLWRPTQGNHYILSLHFIHVLFTIQTWTGRGDEAFAQELFSTIWHLEVISLHCISFGNHSNSTIT